MSTSYQIVKLKRRKLIKYLGKTGEGEGWDGGGGSNTLGHFMLQKPEVRQGTYEPVARLISIQAGFNYPLL